MNKQENLPPHAEPVTVEPQVTVQVVTGAQATEIKEMGEGAVRPVTPEEAEKVKKVIVAVHGIGEQFRYATIRSVVNRFCGYNELPAAVPLGMFYADEKNFLVLKTPEYAKLRSRAFAEVYWAEIPRDVVKDQYTLEEAKMWARTIVERLRLRACAVNTNGPGAQEVDYELVKQVLQEMVETIAVLERLCYLADRAGVFSFNLRKLLDSYLGDVQIVTEFKARRDDILKKFDGVMADVKSTFKKADIYIVAHSEGTVISFLGLLEALRQKQINNAAPDDWIDNVRGFMTLGSPIDKHLLLWPSLWDDYKEANIKWDGKPQIEWWNYFDYSDPVGFRLNEARAWNIANGYGKVFNFPGEHDVGFYRYPFPGKAHVDYWEDKVLFKHFIDEVVGSDPPLSAPVQPGRNPAGKQPTVRQPTLPPTTKPLNWLVSSILPYVGVFALIWAALFVFYKALLSLIDPNEKLLASGTWAIANEVTGMAFLLLGVTIAVRIPRLTRSPYYRVLGVLIAVAAIVVYGWRILELSDASPLNQVKEQVSCLLSKAQGASNDNCGTGWLRLSAAVLTAAVAGIWSRLWRRGGLKPLLITGGGLVLLLALVAVRTKRVPGTNESLWPLLLAWAGFIYLWWLAALIFDLTFAWHVYIRGSKLTDEMGELVNSPYAQWKRAQPSTAQVIVKRCRKGLEALRPGKQRN